jgi:ELWxxDGT repeat protein
MSGSDRGCVQVSGWVRGRRAGVVAVIVGTALAMAAPTAARESGTTSGTVRVAAACATAVRPSSASDGSDATGLARVGAGRATAVRPAAVGAATLVRDIDPSGSSSPQRLTPFLGQVAFVARDDAHGTELWITTASSAKRLRDIAPGTGSSVPSNLTVVGSTLYFLANDGTHGRELWKSDGTTAGTKLVRDIRHGAKGSSAGNLTPFHGKLYLAANDGVHGGELWKSDGTSAGTKLVKDIQPSGTALYPPGLDGTMWAVFQGRLYFGATGAREGLWRTDGTPAGTGRVAKQLLLIEQLVATSTRLYFMSSPDDGGCALPGPYVYASDGTTAGTHVVEMDGPLGSLVAFHSHAWFGANFYAPYRRLYRSAGTDATTGKILPKIALDDDDTPIEAVGGSLFLSQHGALTMSDGTGAGTIQLGDPDTGWRGRVNVVKLGGLWYFPGRDATGDWELWQTDGTPLGTVIAAEVNVGGNGSVRSVVKSGGVVWFSADDGTHGKELFRYVP